MNRFAKFMAAALAAFALAAGCGETVGTSASADGSVAGGTTGGSPATLGQVTGLVAERSGMQVLLQWNTAPNAAMYEVTRHNGVVEVLGTTESTTFADDLSSEQALLREELGYTVLPLAPTGAEGDPSEMATVPPMTFGTIIVSAYIGNERVDGANVFLDGEATGERTPCDLTNVPSGAHTISFAKSGLIPYEDVDIELDADGTAEVVGAMILDPTGRWQDQETFEIYELAVDEVPVNYQCPDGGLQAWGDIPTGRFCIERDGTLSLCKYRAEECADWGYGQMTANRIVFYLGGRGGEPEDFPPLVYERIR